MNQSTYLNGGNAAYINSLYEQYLVDPDGIDFGSQKFFEGFDLGISSGQILQNTTSGTDKSSPESKEINVLNLINGYRAIGHLFADTNPVRERRLHFPGKDLQSFGLDESDLDTVFDAGSKVGLGPATLRAIRDLLEQTYCGSIGVEYKYIRDPDKIKWLESRMEADRNATSFSTDHKNVFLKNSMKRLFSKVFWVPNSWERKDFRWKAQKL